MTHFITFRRHDLAQALSGDRTDLEALWGELDRIGIQATRFVHPYGPADPSTPIEGKVNAHSPETAQEAARRPEHMIAWGNDRTEVLLALYRYRAAVHYGLNAARLSEMVGKSRNQTASRLLELREMGLVEYRQDPDTGKVITAPTDHPPSTSRGRVHFITDAGRWAIRNLPSATWT